MRHPGNRPPIVEVISSYVVLRQSGKEFIGLCPFHSEKTPSFTVNEEKGLFHCFGCGESGDAITFVRKVEGLSFKEALSRLGLSDQVSPVISQEVRAKQKILKEASQALLSWASALSEKVAARMREIGARGQMAKKIRRELPEADKVLLEDEIKRCGREWIILEALHEDLFNPDLTLDFWQQRESLERLVK